MRYQGIVNCTANNVPLSGFPQDGNVFLAVKADESEPADNVLDTGKRLGGGGLVGMREPCKR